MVLMRRIPTCAWLYVTKTMSNSSSLCGYSSRRRAFTVSSACQDSGVRREDEFSLYRLKFKLLLCNCVFVWLWPWQRGKQVQEQRVHSHAQSGISDIPPRLSARTPSALARSETRPEKKPRLSQRSPAWAAENERNRDGLMNGMTMKASPLVFSGYRCCFHGPKTSMLC